MTDPVADTPAADRVSWLARVAYGSGGIIPIALFNIAGQLMGLLGNISLGLSAFWLGTIMIIPRLWDAVSDPIVGHLSDNARTRWGRRRPYILVGGLAVAFSFVAMWWVPRGPAVQAYFGGEAAYNWFQLSYILVGLLLFFTACTVFEIPHGALGMEMSRDYHERTRLFSAKSFLGNLFAMGTPWLIAITSLELFSGPGGDLIDGMRYVSIAIAAVLIPLAIWWFKTLREPGFTHVAAQEKTPFWMSMRTAASNRTFLILIGIVFTLAMGFNFVSLFNYYITIFYLYEGDVAAAGPLLGIAGTVWAVTGLVAVFPLNFLSESFGKSRTMLIAIGLMCLAQVTKIYCYHPTYPYLILIPTVLLSAGMLMFFTLGASMVGDLCDEDELRTGTRSEGSYYSIYWWFIKMGTAFASFVTGVLLVYTQFDETQNVQADKLRGAIQVAQAEAKQWSEEDESISQEEQRKILAEQLETATRALQKLESHFQDQPQSNSRSQADRQLLLEQLEETRQGINGFTPEDGQGLLSPQELQSRAESALKVSLPLKKQSPTTLLRLRVVEIGLPLVLSIVSIWLTLKYPLTEERCYEIKSLLEARRKTNEGNVDHEVSSP